MATQGTFILADIGGYTGFLTGVGIEHGKEITSHLLNSLLKCNRGRWKLANIEGDCLFLYCEGREPPEELLAHVRALYEDFCDRITDIAARSSCPCGACSRTNDLSLKFIVHAGEFDTQRIGNRTELIGPDVVLAHRLLKNSVPLPEYALLTRQYGGAAPAQALPSRDGRDSYEDVGNVDYVAHDLAPARADYDKRRERFVTEEEAGLAVVEEISAPADLVWNALSDVKRRVEWQASIKQMDLIQGEKGRIGEVHRCVHNDGSNIVHLTVAIDEQARRMTERVWASRLVKDVYITSEVQPLNGEQSRAGFYCTWNPAVPLVSHVMLPLVLVMLRRSVRKDFAGLKVFCEQKAAVGR
jgi:hypothetical protein